MIHVCNTFGNYVITPSVYDVIISEQPVLPASSHALQIMMIYMN